jgi:hypothetical protein
MKKRKRVPPPTEELSSDADRHYGKGEALTGKKQDAAGEDYRGFLEQAPLLTRHTGF